MITVYLPAETDFSHNGLGAVSPISAEVTEELNGMFELEMLCPATEQNLERLDDDYIIKAPSPRVMRREDTQTFPKCAEMQLFRVYNHQKKLDNTITVNARHIFYDNLYNIVDSAQGRGLTADAAMKRVFAGARGFTARSTILDDVRADIDIYDVNAVAAVLRKDTSGEAAKAGLIQLYGGELLRDNFDIALVPALGEDRGFTVRYRKNLTGLNFTRSVDAVVTRVKPIGRTKDGKPLYLPEVYIDSPNIGLYFMPKRYVLDCPDAKIESGKVTQAQAFEMMREKARELFVNGADLPKVNVKVDFVLLAHTSFYEEYSVLEDVRLGDVVSVLHEGLGVTLKAKCVKYKYDCLRGRYAGIELGDVNETLSRSIERGASGAAAHVSTALTSHIAGGGHLSDSERQKLDKLGGGESADIEELREAFAAHINGGGHLSAGERAWLENAMAGEADVPDEPADAEEVI